MAPIAATSPVRFTALNSRELQCAAWICTLDTDRFIMDGFGTSPDDEYHYKGQIKVHRAYHHDPEGTPDGEYGLEIWVYGDINPAYNKALDVLLGEEMTQQLRAALDWRGAPVTDQKYASEVLGRILDDSHLRMRRPTQAGKTT